MQPYSFVHPQEVGLVISDKFDFTDYSFLRMNQAPTSSPIEEWVHNDELAEWKRILGLETDERA